MENRRAVNIKSKEKTTQDRAKSGTKTPKMNGPAVGHTSGNKTMGGGVNRSTRKTRQG